MTLGHSRKSVRLLTWRSSAQIWAGLHEQAFRRLGGAPRVIVHDYVARHIIVILFPPSLCGRVGWLSGLAWMKRGGSSRDGEHNRQSEASQLSSASSERQTGRRGNPSEASGGSQARSAASLARVLISA